MTANAVQRQRVLNSWSLFTIRFGFAFEGNWWDGPFKSW